MFAFFRGLFGGKPADPHEVFFTEVEEALREMACVSSPRRAMYLTRVPDVHPPRYGTGEFPSALLPSEDA